MGGDRRTIPAYDDAGTAAGYDKRPSTTRAELKAIARLLEGRPVGERILDVPCGRGRLAPFLHGLSPATLLAVDGSRVMIEEARSTHGPGSVADAGALPFADRSFDLVLCMRLLHHFGEPADRIAILHELGRVSRDLVLFSYYDSRTLEGLRRRWRRKRPSARVGIPSARMRRELRTSGLQLLLRAPLLSLVREQTLVLAKSVPHTANLG